MPLLQTHQLGMLGINLFISESSVSYVAKVDSPVYTVPSRPIIVVSKPSECMSGQLSIDVCQSRQHLPAR